MNESFYRPEIRIPPSDESAEVAVLGSMIMSKDACFTASQILNIEDFYRERNRVFYSVILHLFDQGITIDPISLNAELEKVGELENVGGVGEICKLIDGSFTPSNVEHYCKIIKEKSQARKIITVCNQIVNDAYEPMTELEDLLEKSEVKFFEALEIRERKDKECEIKDLTMEVHSRITRSQKGEYKNHVPSGFRDFDIVFEGWEKSALTIIKAPPKVGKSMLMINSFDRIATIQGIPAIYIILDMTRETLVLRLLSRRLGETIHDIMNIQTTRERIENELSKIHGLPVVILGQWEVGNDYKVMLRWIEHYAKIKGAEICFIDSFTKIRFHSDKHRTEESQISEMIDAFQSLAQKRKIAIVGTVDENDEGKAKGSRRWDFGPDSVYSLKFDREKNELELNSVYVRSTGGGSIVLATNFAHSDVRNHEKVLSKRW